jgi:hypothetical protein
VVEDLSKRREPMPHMAGAPLRACGHMRLPFCLPADAHASAHSAAIYFISPCERSVRQLIEDFAGPLQMYKKAHVFFSNRAFETDASGREPIRACADSAVCAPGLQSWRSAC